MAATGTRQQQPTATRAAAVVDPKFELAEKAGSYVLRLTLTGFRKDDFRVQVDGAGRLTVRSATRPGAGGPGSSLHKVFQLPATASLDDITGRFEAGVLTLTVPKRGGAAPPTSIEEIKKSKPGVAKEENAKPTPPAEVDGAKKMPREERATKPTPPAEVDGAKKMSKEEGAAKPPPPTSHQLPSKDSGAGKKETNGVNQPATRDDGSEKKEAVVGTEPKESAFSKTTRQVAEQVQRMEEEANRRKQEQRKPAPAPKKEEEVKPKAPQPAVAATTPEKPTPKPEVANGEKAKAAVDRESLAERVRRRGEEERAKAAAAATAIETKAEQEKKAVASTCMAWKERIAGELKGLTDMKWADNAVEMARKNKEVVAFGVAAFSLGFLVSQKLFRK